MLKERSTLILFYDSNKIVYFFVLQEVNVLPWKHIREDPNSQGNMNMLLILDKLYIFLKGKGLNADKIFYIS